MALLLEIQSLAAICASRRDSARGEGHHPTMSRLEPSHGAQIRAQPVAMRILSVTSGRQMARHEKSQKVVDFMDKTGLLCS